jgi:hypothetical protein
MIGSSRPTGVHVRTTIIATVASEDKGGDPLRVDAIIMMPAGDPYYLSVIASLGLSET